ncbi:MAG TPA: hypothetical protein PKB15_03255 [Acidimicrobiia bacterium]|nr:hypothetical protein [Acidimicrobiia bacterium]
MFTPDEEQQIKDVEQRCIHALFEDDGLFEQSTLLFESISTNAELVALGCIKRCRDIFIALSHMKKYSDQQIESGDSPILPNPVTDIGLRSCLETVALGWYIMKYPDRALTLIKNDWDYRQDYVNRFHLEKEKVEFNYVDPVSLYRGDENVALTPENLIGLKGLSSTYDMIVELGTDLGTKASAQTYKILCTYAAHPTFSSINPYMGPGPEYVYPRIDETSADFFRINLYGFTVELLKKLVDHLNAK